MKLHPDFDSIRKDQQFHDWANDQPKWVKDALYTNSTDPYACARAIDLYKADMGISKSKKSKEPDAKDAARSVSKGRGGAPSGEGQRKWSESRVAKMSDQEYDKHEDEIFKAVREGRFDYDISGGAR